MEAPFYGDLLAPETSHSAVCLPLRSVICDPYLEASIHDPPTNELELPLWSADYFGFAMGFGFCKWTGPGRTGLNECGMVTRGAGIRTP